MRNAIIVVVDREKIKALFGTNGTYGKRKKRKENKKKEKKKERKKERKAMESTPRKMEKVLESNF